MLITGPKADQRKAMSKIKRFISLVLGNINNLIEVRKKRDRSQSKQSNRVKNCKTIFNGQHDIDNFTFYSKFTTLDNTTSKSNNDMRIKNRNRVIGKGQKENSNKQRMEQGSKFSFDNKDLPMDPGILISLIT